MLRRMLGLALAIAVTTKWTDERLVKSIKVQGTVKVVERNEVARGKSKRYYTLKISGKLWRSQDVPQQGASIPQKGGTTLQQGRSLPGLLAAKIFPPRDHSSGSQKDPMDVKRPIASQVHPRQNT